MLCVESQRPVRRRKVLMDLMTTTLPIPLFFYGNELLLVGGHI